MGDELGHGNRITAMRYRLRTLMILLALGPPVLGWGWAHWEQYQRRQAFHGQKNLG
jgi:hypothetical protein